MQVGAGEGAPSPIASKSIVEATFAVVDVETSGLSAGKHRLLQVAVVLAGSDGTITDRWVSYVRPRFRWLARLGPKHIHGITRCDLKDAPPLDIVVAEVVRRTEGTVLTAHNLGFDRAFLRAGARKTGQTLGHAGEVCTLILARRLDPDNAWSHRLGDLCERYGIALTKAHDALADAEATAQLLPHLLAEVEATTVGELVELLARRGPLDSIDTTGSLPRPDH